MPRWQKKSTPEPTVPSIEVEGLVAQCRFCNEQTDMTTYLPEVGALTWKCKGCDRINVLEDFNLP